MELKNKVAIITGGAVRIGRALTLGLAKEGCNVFLHYRRSSKAARKTKEEAENKGIKVVTYQANLANLAETAKIVPAALQVMGRIDILINNAAIFPADDKLDTLSSKLWDATFDINLRAPFILSKEFASLISPKSQGKIMNINDARIPRPAPDHFAYRLAKRGLWDMTKILALELAPQIQVNTVAIGAILPPPGTDQQGLERLRKKRIPLKKMGNPAAVVHTVLHLLREDFITGTTVTLDGGEFLKN